MMFFFSNVDVEEGLEFYMFDDLSKFFGGCVFSGDYRKVVCCFCIIDKFL